jgi:pyruvate formate-lyase activating enzyme-like uncharacterized protein
VDKIIAFNQDQVVHMRMVRENVREFCNQLLHNVSTHDESKWYKNEYETFVDSRASLRGSTDGKDEAYQQAYKSQAIQHHVCSNEHHPEFWDQVGDEMPLGYIIEMFFDWYSRCEQRGGKMEDFWEYNMAKLNNQPRAKAVCELLRSQYA